MCLTSIFRKDLIKILKFIPRILIIKSFNYNNRGYFDLFYSKTKINKIDPATL